MHILAVKTKQETVSMRVITLVTLFFLPGTFISVSHTPDLSLSQRPFHQLIPALQTIMSTDIIKFPTTVESGTVFQLGAFQLYMAITVPMMALTFASWWIVYWFVNRRQESKPSKFGFSPPQDSYHDQPTSPS